MTIETNITKMLGIKKPIISAPMGPFYTTDLTIAVSEAGGLGTLSHTNIKRGQSLGKETTLAEAEAMTREALSEASFGGSVEAMKENMEYVVEHTDKPFGFNIRTSRNETQADRLCTEIPKFIMDNPKIKEQCVYALTSAGSSRRLPQSKSWQKLRNETSSQIKLFHVTPALWLAEKAIEPREGSELAVDGIVCTGLTGGGHQSYEKVSTLVLLQQINQKYPDFPKIACGGFATGEGLAAALTLGAGAIAMGSRFIATEESEFHEAYKNVIPPAKAQDTIYVTGVLGPIRLWRNTYSLHHGVVSSKEEKLAEEEKVKKMSQEEYMEYLMDMANAYLAAYRGDTDSGAVLLGQSIGIINSIEKVPDLMDKIVKDAETYLKKATSYIK
jgi:NAD(P)H-dependent flavin oxidoreductase YrpB (nitropropane dioxygenase family)